MASYDLEQALKARAVLRSAAGSEEEQFDDEQLVGMLSDEIRALRNTGSSDEQIAALLKSDASITVSPETITKYYVDTSAYENHGR